MVSRPGTRKQATKKGKVMRARLISVDDPSVVRTVRGKVRVRIGVSRKGRSCVSG